MAEHKQLTSTIDLEIRPEPEVIYETRDSTFDEESIDPPRFERIHQVARLTKKAIGRAAAIGALAGSVLAFQNPEDMHLAYGLVSWGNMATPATNNCEMGETSADSASPAPTTTALESSSSPSSSSSTSTTEALTIDPEDDISNSQGSSASANEWWRIDEFLRVPFQYTEYFDNEILRFTSKNSGIEYVFYQYGKGDAPTITPESLEFLETAAFPPSAQYYNQQKRDGMACIGDALFENRIREGHIRPIVVPAKPAEIRNGLIRSPSGRGQEGFTMPQADIDFLWWDLNPKFDEFIIVTTGSDFDPDNPAIENNTILHELQHRLFEDNETYRTGDFSLNLLPQERLARSLSDKADFSGIYDCILPVVIYGDPEVLQAEIDARCDGENENKAAE